MKRFLATLVATAALLVTFLVPSGHAAEASSSTSSVMYADSFDERTSVDGVNYDVCGNVQSVSNEDSPVYSQEIDPNDRASSLLLPINRWSESTSNFYTNLDEGVFSINMKRMQRESVAGSLFSFSSTIWEGTTSTSVWATAFCPLNTMAAPIDKIIGDFGTFLISGDGAPLLVMLLTALIVIALWGSRRGTGFQFSFKELASKAVVIVVLSLMVAGASDATDEEHGTGLSPANIVAKSNEVVTNLGSLTTAGAMDFIAENGYAQSGDGGPTLDCRVATHSLNQAYKSKHMGTSGAGDLSAEIPMMLSNAWLETGYMSWMRAQFGPPQGESGPQNNAGCYVLDWTSEVPQVTNDMNDLESRADLMGAALRGGFDEDEFGTDDDKLGNALSSANSSDDRNTAEVNRVIAPSSEEQQHQAMMFLSICRPNEDADGLPEEAGFWEIHPNFDDGDFEPEDCANAWDVDTSDSDIDTFQMPDKLEDVNDDYGQGTRAADYINYVNGSHSMSATGAGFVMMIASGILFLIFGFISLVVVLVRAAMVMTMIFVFVMALKGLMPRQTFNSLGKAAKLLIGVTLLALFTQILYSVIVGVSGLLNMVGAQFLEVGGIPYLLWVSITPAMTLILVHFVFKWAKLPSPLSIKGAKAWGKGLALDGGNATVNAMGGSQRSPMDTARRGSQNVMDRMRGRNTRAAEREGSREAQLVEQRNNTQAKSPSSTGGPKTASGEDSTAAQLASQQMQLPEGEHVTRADRKAVAQLRRQERKDQNRQRRTQRVETLKSPRKLGNAMWSSAKAGASAIKARGVRGNLRRAASGTAKFAGVTAVAGALGVAGGLPAIALGVGGLKAAQMVKDRMADRGLRGRENRDTFNRDVEAYVSAGRPDIEDDRSATSEHLRQTASESKAGQWAKEQAERITDTTKSAGDKAKETMQHYWQTTKDTSARLSQNVGSKVKSQFGSDDDVSQHRKDVEYATRHGYDADDEQQLEQAHSERVKREGEAAQEKQQQQQQREQRRQQRAAHRDEVNEHNAKAQRQRGAAREAMRQKQQEELERRQRDQAARDKNTGGQPKPDDGQPKPKPEPKPVPVDTGGNDTTGKVNPDGDKGPTVSGDGGDVSDEER